MKIKLSNCEFDFEIDDEDINRVTSHNTIWGAIFRVDKYQMNVTIQGIRCRSRLTKEMVLLSHILIDCPKGMVIDHIDRNVLNNKKSNLRLATKSQSMMNRGKHSSRSKYKNVHRKIGCKTWSFGIKKAGKLYEKFGFLTEIDAAIAANEKLKELHGEFAVLNKIKLN